jgi:hypothetical protein
MAHIITGLQGSSLDHIKIKRALLSVSDKTGLIELAKALGGITVNGVYKSRKRTVKAV